MTSGAQASSTSTITTTRLADVVDTGDQFERITSDSALPLFRGLLHAEVGQGESGKTWIAAHAVLDAARQGHQILVLDGEMSARAWRQRLHALSATEQDLQLIFYAEINEQSVDPTAVAAACSRPASDQESAGVGLIVWDSALSMLSRVVHSENDNAQVAKVYDQIRDIVRRTKTAGLIVDHTARDSSSLVSRGATAKFNALDISYGIRLSDGSVPSTADPWSSLISIEKDRHGLLGARRDSEASFFPLAAGIELSITPRTTATHRLSAQNPVAAFAARIAELDPPPTSANDAQKRIGGNRNTALKGYRQWKEGM